MPPQSGEPAVPSHDRLDDSEASAASSSGARVLVADDSAAMREHLVRLLAPRWSVEAVEDGEAALALALERPPALVLSEVMMPRMDGVALLRALRADARTRAVPVVLLSDRAGEEGVGDGLEAGADDYLVKPFSARELLTRVATHLEMAQLRRRATDLATELTEARAALLRDLARKNKELESFSYSVSHDLRAPLRGMAGFSQILVEDFGDRLGATGMEHLGRIQAGAQRMGELIDDLLELSKVERKELHRASMDLSGLGRRIGEALGRSEPDRAVTFVVEEGLVAQADARLVEILLENLLGNAWKFTTKTASPRIELGSLQTDGHTTFFVRDNGAGFDEAHSRRLFSPFQRLHSVAEFPGRGIGLATVSRIVDRHAGRVWAEGTIGVGATVYWTLPNDGRWTTKP